MEKGLRVAVAGASGIGKHHAKWHHDAGAEVVGFLGSTVETCARTESTLSELFSFRGRGYTDLPSLLTETNPDIVDVCLPNELHHDVAVSAISAGCHVLCEKPLVWYPESTPALQLGRARDMVQRADERGVLMGICTQYVAGLDQYGRLYEAAHGPVEQIGSLYVEMETLSRGRQRTPEQIWVDMGPHPLSLLLAWLPDSELDDSSLRTCFAGSQVRATFRMRSSLSECECEIVVRDKSDGVPVRQFGINGALAQYEGKSDETGIYRSVMRMGESESVGPDLLSILIRDFHAACLSGTMPMVTGATGIRNIDLMIRIMQNAGVVP